MSRLKSNPAAYQSFFRKGVQLSGFVFLPCVVAGFVLARPLVLTILGSDWEPTVPLFQALCPAALMSATAPATTWVYMSWGHVDRFLKAVVFNTVCLMVGFAIAVPYGTFWVAITFSTVVCVVRIPNILYAFHPTPLQVSDMFIPLLTSAIAACVASVAVILMKPLTIFLKDEPVQLIAGVLVFGFVYFLAFAASPSGRSQAVQVLSLFHRSSDE